MALVENEQLPEARVVDYGRIGKILWPGGVSVDRLIEQGIASPEKIQNAVEHINEFYVRVNPLAKTRCIDGRIDPNFDPSMLGPQVPGGAPGAALAYRLGVDKSSLLEGNTFYQDAAMMIDAFTKLGFAPGGHRDEHSEDIAEKVGCGAIDAMDVVVDVMTNKQFVPDHKRIVMNLLGDRYKHNNYLKSLGAGLVLSSRSEEYFKGREKIIDLLESKFEDSVATLLGNHQECLVVVNLVPDTTLSTNAFSENYDGMQAFGYDLWRSMEMAHILAQKETGIKINPEDINNFITARVACSIATLMALTDGSQRLLVRMPA